jgi:hypothetical protein
MSRRLHIALAAAATLVCARPAGALTCPKVMFILDAGGSMNNDPAGGNTMPSKFELARQAIIDFVNAYGDRLQIGVADYASDSFHNDQQCVDDTVYDAAKCAADPEHNCYGILIEPAHDQTAQLVTTLKAVKNAPLSWHDPMGETIHRIAQDPAMHDPDRKNFIIVVTDGVPSCNSQDLMDLGQQSTPSFTINAINDARNQKPSIHTWVIGFDGIDADGLGGLDSSALSDMAQAGGEPYGSHSGEKQCGNNVPCYYSVNGNRNVMDALMNIVMVGGGGEFGGVLCDDSCLSNGCPTGQTCEKSELDPVAHCVPDPCMGMQCGGGQFCRGGKCVNACTSGCKGGQVCVDGNCVADPCDGVSCMNGTVCCPIGVMGCATGTCGPDFCSGKMCGEHEICQQGTGKCIVDPCSYLSCPSGTVCQSQSGGNCASTSVSNRGKGCAIGARADAGFVSGLGLSLIALLGLALTLRRRRG